MDAGDFLPDENSTSPINQSLTASTCLLDDREDIFYRNSNEHLVNKIDQQIVTLAMTA